MVRLAPDERLLWEGKRAWADYSWYWAGVAGLGTFGIAVLVRGFFYDETVVSWLSGTFFLAGIFLAGWILVDRLAGHYSVTTERVVAQEGLLDRKTTEIEIRHIQEVGLQQDLLQRMFGTGSVELSSASQGGIEVVFRGIADAEGVKEIIRGQLRRERKGQETEQRKESE